MCVCTVLLLPTTVLCCPVLPGGQVRCPRGTLKPRPCRRCATAPAACTRWLCCTATGVGEGIAALPGSQWGGAKGSLAAG